MLLTKLTQQKVLPVLVLETIEQAKPLADCLLEYQLNAIEITLRTPQALDVIQFLSENYPELSVGAGTVLTPEQLSQVQQAGAGFAIAPGATDTLLQAGQAAEIDFVPGIMTPSEAMRAKEHGYSLQKLFPAEVAGGCNLLKAMGAPLAELNFCPTGGISINNMAQYLSLTNVPVVGGTWLAPLELIQQQNWQQIRQNMQLLQSQLKELTD